jgi:uncharacterized membrane protein
VSHSVAPARGIVRLLWSVVIFLMLIGVAIVVRRTLALSGIGVSRDPAGLDPAFARYRVLTMIHIIPGLLFILLTPLQFIRDLRNRRPRLHRWAGRVAVASGIIVGITALVMSSQMSIGGVSETAATMFFAVIFLFALVRAFLLIRRRDVALHREWMIRAFAIGLAVATIRPIVGVFFATRALTHLTPHDFFGAAFWLGFTTHLIAAEAWINYTRPRFARSAANS